jgi:hypothetical protein
MRLKWQRCRSKRAQIAQELAAKSALFPNPARAIYRVTEKPDSQTLCERLEMENLQVAPDVRQEAADRIGGSERRRRHPPAALRDTAGSSRQPEDRVQAGQSESNSAASGRRGRHGPRRSRARRGAADPIIVTLLAGLAAEVVGPWAVIWLSDALVFDIPAWSLGLVFGVPAALTILAVVIQRALRAWSRQAMRAAIPTWQG